MCCRLELWLGFLLTFSETFKECRGETAKQRLAGLHSIIFIIHAGFPLPRPNTALPAPLPEIIKNISWNALTRIRRRRERFQVGRRREGLNVRKTDSLRNIIQDVLLFVEKKSHRSLGYRLCLSHQINPRNLSRGTNFIGFCLVEGMRCFPALTLR